jgi:hypothetical protein
VGGGGGQSCVMVVIARKPSFVCRNAKELFNKSCDLAGGIKY